MTQSLGGEGRLKIPPEAGVRGYVNPKVQESSFGSLTLNLSYHKNQNHSNFDGERDRVPVYGRPNIRSPHDQFSRIVYDKHTLTFYEQKSPRP
jgi:hypothetical protein